MAPARSLALRPAATTVYLLPLLILGPDTSSAKAGVARPPRSPARPAAHASSKTEPAGAVRLPPGYVFDTSLLPHRDTAATARKYVLELDKYLKHTPTPEHTTAAFGAACAWLAERGCDGAGGGRPLVLDSGCGTGRSTLLFAEQHPDCLVVGVDRSLARLRKGRNVSGAPRETVDDEGNELVHSARENALLVRADLPVFWRLAAAKGWRLRQHRLLFPNPYPKGSMLTQRWHAHPCFSLVLRLGGSLELRSNWRTYLDEALIATHAVAEVASAEVARPEVAAAQNALAAGCAVVEYAHAPPFASEFEEKYAAAKLPLFRLVLELDRLAASSL
ncbi:hypothetical protein T492DRAFT_1059793 [Pavlovales sp. CCMP2436]|nr:hypothetical protein T492DRAFT_1059793 [Pavlovales sp. CCMP2436]